MDLDFLLEAMQGSSLDRREYQYFDSLLNKNTILFNDCVNENIFEEVYIPLRNMARDESIKEVTLIMHTPGGSPLDALPLCNVIDKYPKPLKIIVYGHAFSMGTILLCAGNNNSNVKKYCYPFSYGLLHAGETGFSGEANVVKDTREFYENQVDGGIRDYILAGTKITPEEYNEHERRQWFMNAEEMKRLGLIDYIIGVDVDDI